ncbi:hypothetical protein V6N13_113465 [Hibiscus sabdariffa]
MRRMEISGLKGRRKMDRKKEMRVRLISLNENIGLNRSRRRLVRHRCRLDAKRKMAIKFLDWYLKIAVGSALIGGSMELFMIKTGFYDKVTVLESEKRAWENSPEAQAMREALNPWRNHDAQERKSS